MHLQWDEVSFLEDTLHVRHRVAENIVEMLAADQTIPFIARYRRDKTDDMGPDDLRKALACFNEAKSIKSRCEAVLKHLDKSKKPVGNDVIKAVKCSQSLDEIESHYAPFKPGSEGSLTERAKALGLESSAKEIVQGRSIALEKLVNVDKKGVANVAKVETGIVHIITDIICKNPDTQKAVKSMTERAPILIESMLSKCADDKKNEQQKFKDYDDFSMPVKQLKSHQILALNRGESLKLLSVKVKIPGSVESQISDWIKKNLLNRVVSQHSNLVEKCLKDCYTRVHSPQITRATRSQSKKCAEEESVNVFAINLKELLMQTPCKGRVICGIDPGFTHGCKTAIISPSNSILATTVFHLPPKSSSSISCLKNLSSLLKEHNCSTIAIGNGTACRETEKIISTAISQNLFQPLKVHYCIVNECGASIYSVSELAQKEMPDVDPNLRSAASIARRLQDPLAELVKIDPKNLGVGMYQHDLPPKLLGGTLDSVVEECVSFVGVDVNTCSVQLLQRTAGMNMSRAGAVLKYRDKVGRINNRDEILAIKGIGTKTFQQAAGFLRIFASQPQNTSKDSLSFPQSQSGRKRKAGDTNASPVKKKKKENNVANILDATAVHPESYDMAKKLLTRAGMSLENVGSSMCINKIKELNVKRESEALKAPVQSVQQVIEALATPIEYDLREEGKSKPVFREGVISMEALEVGMTLGGQVTNVTSFGAFIDIGVGSSGLLHVSELRKRPPISVGMPLDVRVKNVDIKRKRIGLEFA